MLLNDYLYILCFPFLCLVLNGVVVSIGNFKAWGLGFKPHQSQNNLCYSFFSYFFKNAPWRTGVVDPDVSFADTNFQCLTFSILWLKSKFCLCLSEQTQYIMKHPLTPLRVGVTQICLLMNSNFWLPTFSILWVKSKLYLLPKQAWVYPGWEWPLATIYMHS